MAKIKLGSTLVMDILLLLVTQGFLEMNGYNFILCLKEVEREQLYLPSNYLLPTLWGGGRRGRRQRNFLFPDGAQVDLT